MGKVGKINFDKKEERISEQVETIKSLYESAFVGLESKVLNIEQFKLNIDWRTSQSVLIAADKAIVNQTQVLKFLSNIYKDENIYVELRKRLIQVHKMIAKVLKVEYKLWGHFPPRCSRTFYSLYNVKSTVFL